MAQRLFTILCCVALMLLWNAVPRLQAQEPETVLEVKASFVLNFMRFTEWPPSEVAVAEQHYVLAVVGDTPLAAQIKKSLNGQLINNSPIEVIVYTDLPLLRRAHSMPHALFVTAAMSWQWPEIAQFVAASPVLTIADFPDFCAQGGMLTLVHKEESIGFEANPEAARSAYLLLNAQLLQLANIVSTRRESTP